MPPPAYHPMLAGRGLPPAGVAGWAVEPKLDGWRAVVTVHADVPGGLVVRTRTGRDVSSGLPELADLARSGLSVVLDGELVADAGRAEDFYRLGPRLASRRRPRGGVTFVAFDVLWCDGTPLTNRPYAERREVLDTLASQVTATPSWTDVTADEVLAACEQHGVEGVVWKRIAAVYRPGRRSGDWRKVKCDSWRSDHGPRRAPPERRASVP